MFEISLLYLFGLSYEKILSCSLFFIFTSKSLAYLSNYPKLFKEKFFRIWFFMTSSLHKGSPNLGARIFAV